jgi:hypothetical protein
MTAGRHSSGRSPHEPPQMWLAWSPKAGAGASLALSPKATFASPISRMSVRTELLAEVLADVLAEVLAEVRADLLVEKIDGVLKVSDQSELVRLSAR